jgi:RNA ligase (TIGR02306 family)
MSVLDWDPDSIDIDDIGLDVSNELGIQKWEAPIPASLAGQVQGPFPSQLRKTDQERCQNLVEEIFVENKDAKYEVTIKLDGSSMTVFAHEQLGSGVCSRNLQLKVNEENADNTLVRVAVQSGLLEVLEALARAGRGYCVQGEIMGPGIQGNRENLKTHQLFVFDIQDISANEYLTPAQREALMEELYLHGVNCDLVKHVPVLATSAHLSDTLGIVDIDGMLKFAEGKSLNSPSREGVVFKRLDGKFSFKAISNSWLMKNE